MLRFVFVSLDVFIVTSLLYSYAVARVGIRGE